MSNRSGWEWGKVRQTLPGRDELPVFPSGGRLELGRGSFLTVTVSRRQAVTGQKGAPAQQDTHHRHCSQSSPPLSLLVEL